MSFIRKIFNGEERSVLVKKNIAGSVLIKGWSCIVQLLLVPVTLGCLNQYEYGIWLTISSILLWVDQFDIGLGNGLRNKLAEAIARNELERARCLVSTTFVMLILIVVPILLISLWFVYNFDLNAFLNIDETYVSNIRDVLVVSVSLVGATFIFKFIGNVYLALQLPAINNLLVVAGQTLSLVGIFILSLSGREVSLLEIACVYTVSPLLVYVASYPLTFTRYKYLRPSLCLFDKKELDGLFSLGIKFFFVQIAGLVIFATSNILISRLLSPADVTPYQISYKYFSLTIMLFTLIAAPLWSATTDAYTKGDWEWIKRMMNKMKKVMIAFFVLLGVMFAVSGLVYHVWIGNEVEISYMLSFLMALYMALLIFSTCYSNILFGIGKIRVITVVTVLEAVVYIPLAIFLGYKVGLYGIVIALILVNLLCAVCNKIQFDKLSAGTAHGIWDK